MQGARQLRCGFPPVLAKAKFPRHFKLIWVVQFYREK
jgi:hypothetical protein